MPTFTCSLCLSEEFGTRTNSILLPQKDKPNEPYLPCCKTCFLDRVVDQFWASIRNPSTFPFRFGDTPLRFQDFEHHIPNYGAMAKAYGAVRAEIEIPAELRMYCAKDGKFIGAKEGDRRERVGKLECADCGRWYCVKCSQRAEANHACRRDDSREAAFEGQVRGVDYQFCPKCGMACGLADGCNSMRCKLCRTELCYLCGVAVAHGDKEHWQRGGCPRFGTKESARPLFDDEVDIVDDGDGQADAHAPGMALQDLAAARERNLRNPAFVIPGITVFSPENFAALREKVLPARRHLDHMRRDLIKGINRDNPITDQQQRVLDLISQLRANYGMFNLLDDGRVHLIERLGHEDYISEVFDRHRKILSFRDSPDAPWAWANVPGLRTQWLWYLNHCICTSLENPVRFEVVYGNAQIKDALAGMWE